MTQLCLIWKISFFVSFVHKNLHRMHFTKLSCPNLLLYSFCYEQYSLLFASLFPILPPIRLATAWTSDTIATA